MIFLQYSIFTNNPSPFNRSIRGPRRHPDSEYFRLSSANSPGAAYDERTTTHGNPSVASTLVPSAIVIDPGAAQGTGAFGDPSAQPAYAGPGVTAPPHEAFSTDRIEITRIPERNVVPEPGPTRASRAWWLFSRLCTLLVPDFLLCCVGRHARFRHDMTPEEKTGPGP